MSEEEQGVVYNLSNINMIDSYVQGSKSALNFDLTDQKVLCGNFRFCDANSNIPSASTSNNDLCPRIYNDGRYSRKSVDNTFSTGTTQTFDNVIVNGNLSLSSGTITDIQHELLLSDSVRINSVNTDPLVITSNSTEVFKIDQSGNIINPSITSIGNSLTSLSSYNGVQDNSLSSLNTSIGVINGSLTSLSSYNTLQDNTLSSHNTSIGTINESLTSLSSYNTLQDNTLTSLNTSIGTINGSLTSLSSYNGVQDNSLTSLNTSIGTINGSLTSLSSYNGVQDNSLSSLNTSIGNINSLNTQQSNSLTGAYSMLSELYTVKQDTLLYDSAPVQNSTKHLTSGSLYNTITPIQNNITTLQNNISTINSTNNSQDNRLTTLENDNSTNKIDISTLQSNVTTINSNRLSSFSYYVNETTSIQSVINSIGETVGATIYLTSSSHNADTSPITCNIQNCNFLGVPCSIGTQMSQISQNIQIGGNVNNNSIVGPITRCRFSSISFLGTVTMTTPNNNRHFFQNCTFNTTFTFSSSNANWIYFYDCDFLTPLTIPSTVCSVIFTRCNFYNQTLTNSASSALQVIFGDCSGLPSFSLGNCIFTGRNSTATIQRNDSTTFNGSTLTGLLTTSSQPNITTLGTLSSLNVSGNLAVTGQITGQTVGSLNTSINNLNSSITSINTTLGQKQNTLVLDNAPTLNSSNFLNSGTLYNTINPMQGSLSSQNTSISNLNSSITSINTTLGQKQNTLVLDSTPTLNSSNFLNSGTLYNKINPMEGSLSSQNTSINNLAGTLSNSISCINVNVSGNYYKNGTIFSGGGGSSQMVSQIVRMTNTPYTITTPMTYGTVYQVNFSGSGNFDVTLPSSTDLTSSYDLFVIYIINSPNASPIPTLRISSGSGTTFLQNASGVFNTYGANLSRGVMLCYDRTNTNWFVLNRAST